MASSEERRQEALERVNAMHDHFDQLRFSYDEAGEEDKVTAVRKIMDRLSEVEENLEQENYSAALSSLNCVWPDSHELERVDERFDFFDNPSVEEHYSDAKAMVDILQVTQED